MNRNAVLYYILSFVFVFSGVIAAFALAEFAVTRDLTQLTIGFANITICVLALGLWRALSLLSKMSRSLQEAIDAFKTIQAIGEKLRPMLEDFVARKNAEEAPAPMKVHVVVARKSGEVEAREAHWIN